MKRERKIRTRCLILKKKRHFFIEYVETLMKIDEELNKRKIGWSHPPCPVKDRSQWFSVSSEKEVTHLNMSPENERRSEKTEFREKHKYREKIKILKILLFPNTHRDRFNPSIRRRESPVEIQNVHRNMSETWEFFGK